MKFSKKIIRTKTHVSSVWHQGMDFMSYYHADMFLFVNYAQSRFLAKDQMLIVLLVEAQSLITRRYSFKFQNNNKQEKIQITTVHSLNFYNIYEVEFLILGANCNEQELFNFRRYFI